ncbi:sugar phosphate isomerase/epimerase family protein [Kribbella sp. NPDC004875]|uniref:sugar phosphate isomerase/epimerase family protein n=1 Tax=Kribbella sp. NPDC004875 TaxID=3364107 RepID=UPI0036A292D2
MQIGIDGRKFPQAAELGPFKLLERCHELGYAGVFFRTVLDITPDLDQAVLTDVRKTADDLGLRIDMGLGKVNPFNTPEAPEVRELGRGDYLKGMTRMIEAVTAIGCHLLWVDTANYQKHDWGLQAIDRFRTDVTWPEQLVATRNFLRQLAPVLRDHDAKAAVETHEEITTTEILQLIEDVGEDVLAVTFDSANVVVRGEDPVRAAQRMAPYTVLTHLRDVVLYPTPRGLARQIRACGDGVIDWTALLGALVAEAPVSILTIENTTARDFNDIPVYDPEWQAGQPDLAVSEVLELVRLSQVYIDDVAAGRAPGPDDYYTEPFDLDRQLGFVSRSAATLRDVLDQKKENR